MCWTWWWWLGAQVKVEVMTKGVGIGTGTEFEAWKLKVHWRVTVVRRLGDAPNLEGHNIQRGYVFPRNKSKGRRLLGMMDLSHHNRIEGSCKFRASDPADRERCYLLDEEYWMRRSWQR